MLYEGKNKVNSRTCIKYYTNVYLDLYMRNKSFLSAMEAYLVTNLFRQINHTGNLQKTNIINYVKTRLMCVQRSLGHCKAMLMPVGSLDKHAVTHSQSVTPRMLPPSVLLGQTKWSEQTTEQQWWATARLPTYDNLSWDR